jgi:hypothetical protein
MKEEMRQTEQLSRVLSDQSLHWLIPIEEARPCHFRNGIRQCGLFFAPVKGIVAVPKQFPLRKIVLLDGSYQNLAAQMVTPRLLNNLS